MNTDDEGASWTGRLETPEISLRDALAEIHRDIEKIMRRQDEVVTLLRRNGS